MTDDWHDHEEEQEEIIYVSKSELKRDMDELKKLGRDLVDMPKAKLAKIPLNQDALEAIELGRKIRNKKDAYRRHIQYFAKVLQLHDLDAIKYAFERMQQAPLLANQHYAKLELIRDDLIANGDTAIQALLEQHPELDRSKLRQFVRQAKKHTDTSKPNKSAKQIFEYLKQSIPVE